MPQSLTGKTALIFGGTGAIGAASARALATAGARVIITYRASATGSASAEELIASLDGAGHRACPADISDTASIEQLRANLAIDCSTLDILVNAAGFTQPVAHADLDALDDALIDEIFRVNWRGQFAAIRTFAPVLKASKDGLIVSLSSIA